MQSIHDLTTKILKSIFGFWYYYCLIYNSKKYMLYKIAKNMDVLLSYWTIKNWKFVSNHWRKFDIRPWNKFYSEIETKELMSPNNIEVRNIIKEKQESFFNSLS